MLFVISIRIKKLTMREKCDNKIVIIKKYKNNEDNKREFDEPRMLN